MSQACAMLRRNRLIIVVLAAVAIGLYAQLPAIDAQFFNDDYLQLGYLKGIEPVPMLARSMLDLYRFSADVAFMRPLSSALMVADYRWFGLGSLGPHFHSLAWYLALLVVVSILFFRVVPEGGGIAALVFAAGRGACTSVVWWCNRHVLVSSLTGCLAIWGYVRWREEGWCYGRWLSLAGILASLAGGETGLQTIAFLVAYEIIGSRDTLGRRGRALGLLLLITFVYIALWIGLGYGAHGSCQYVSPFREPMLYLTVALKRVPALLDFVVAPGGRITLLPLVVVLTLGFRHLRRGHWMLLGGLLSLPISLASPNPTVLAMPCLAAAVAFGVLLNGVLGQAMSSKWPLWRRGVAGVSAAGLLITLGPMSANLARTLTSSERTLFNLQFDTIMGAPLPPRAHVVVLYSPVDVTVGALVTKLYRPQLEVASWTIAPDAVRSNRRLSRPTPEELVLTEDGRPDVRVPLTGAVTDPSTCLLVWHDGRLRRIEAPEPGKSLQLAP